LKILDDFEHEKRTPDMGYMHKSFDRRFRVANASLTYITSQQALLSFDSRLAKNNKKQCKQGERHG
jgi:hypothetical protein